MRVQFLNKAKHQQFIFALTGLFFLFQTAFFFGQENSQHPSPNKFPGSSSFDPNMYDPDQILKGIYCPSQENLFRQESYLKTLSPEQSLDVLLGQKINDSDFLSTWDDNYGLLWISFLDHGRSADIMADRIAQWTKDGAFVAYHKGDALTLLKYAGNRLRAEDFERLCEALGLAEAKDFRNRTKIQFPPFWNEKVRGWVEANHLWALPTLARFQNPAEQNLINQHRGQNWQMALDTAEAWPNEDAWHHLTGMLDRQAEIWREECAKEKPNFSRGDMMKGKLGDFIGAVATFPDREGMALVSEILETTPDKQCAGKGRETYWTFQSLSGSEEFLKGLQLQIQSLGAEQRRGLLNMLHEFPAKDRRDFFQYFDHLVLEAAEQDAAACKEGSTVDLSYLRSILQVIDQDDVPALDKHLAALWLSCDSAELLALAKGLFFFPPGDLEAAALKATVSDPGYAGSDSIRLQLAAAHRLLFHQIEGVRPALAALLLAWRGDSDKDFADALEALIQKGPKAICPLD